MLRIGLLLRLARRRPDHRPHPAGVRRHALVLRLEIDRTRFDAGLKKVAADFPGLVPVAKGNGYGLGMARLAREAASLGADILAVGTAAEVGQLGGVPFERVVVLTPHLPGDPVSDGANVVHTAAGAAALRGLVGRAGGGECRT